MGRYYAALVRDLEIIQQSSGFLHRIPVRSAAHDNTNSGFRVLSLFSHKPFISRFVPACFHNLKSLSSSRLFLQSG